MRKLIATCAPTPTWKIALLVIGLGGMFLILDRLLGLAIVTSLGSIALLIACAIPCLIPLVLLRRQPPARAAAPDQALRTSAGAGCSCGQAGDASGTS